MGEAMGAVCDRNGQPITKLHGLRMLDPNVFTRLPLASADSTNCARNGATLAAKMNITRGLAMQVIASRVECYQSADRWDANQAQCAMEFSLTGT
jgi:hypothetical protein